MGDANDMLRRDLDNQDQKLRRMNRDFKESEIDRQKANSEKIKIEKVLEQVRLKSKEYETKMNRFKQDLKRSQTTSIDATTDSKSNEDYINMKTNFETEIQNLRNKNKKKLQAMEDTLQKKKEDIETLERSRRDDVSSSSAKGESRHTKEIEELRTAIDVERNKYDIEKGNVEIEKKRASSIMEEKRAVVRKMEVLEASMAAEGKGAMGRVEQMKTFRKQVTALEEQIASITLEKEELSESNLKMNTKISDIDRRWKRKMEDGEY